MDPDPRTDGSADPDALSWTGRSPCGHRLPPAAPAWQALPRPPRCSSSSLKGDLRTPCRRRRREQIAGLPATSFRASTLRSSTQRPGRSERRRPGSSPSLAPRPEALGRFREHPIGGSRRNPLRGLRRYRPAFSAESLPWSRSPAPSTDPRNFVRPEETRPAQEGWRPRRPGVGSRHCRSRQSGWRGTARIHRPPRAFPRSPLSGLGPHVAPLPPACQCRNAPAHSELEADKRRNYRWRPDLGQGTKCSALDEKNPRHPFRMRPAPRSMRRRAARRAR